MGYILELSSISQKSFTELKENPNNLPKLNKLFNFQTSFWVFEELTWLVAKASVLHLIECPNLLTSTEHILYPDHDYENDISGGWLYDKQPIIYYDSLVLPKIATALSHLQTQQIINCFDKDEMLEEGVYYQALDSIGVQQRKEHLTKLYPDLKTFFINAYNEKHFVILEYGP